MDKLSIIIPCFNEEEVLPAYYDTMEKIMGQMSSCRFELLFIDDGSNDRTLSILKELNLSLIHI